MNNDFLERNKHIILATLITSLILAIVFAFSGYYPFGDNSILKVDLYHQYAPFHEELRYKILNGESLFYSWQGGLGKEFLSQIAYYTASPISILILFFPSEYLSEAILLFVFIKICLSSTSFSYFLKKAYNEDTPIIAFFGVMYAFIAFTTSFYWNIMWLDSVYLFPLVVLGINRLVEYDEYKPYLYSLMICIIVNFYIAFLVCVFITLYFLIKVFSDYSFKSQSKIIYNKFFKFALLSLLAGGTTMFLAIPTVVALTRTQTSSASFPNFEMYSNVYQIISSHFSGVSPVVLARNEDLPNLYSGVLTMMLLPTYFFNKNIKFKEKAFYIILLLFMIACSVFKQLDFIIHGLHFPANLPHRYTFIYSFMILMLAYKGLINIKEGFNIKILYLFVILNSIALYYTEFILVNNIEDIGQVLTDNDVYMNIALMIVYTILIILYRHFSLENLKKGASLITTDKNKFVYCGLYIFVFIAIQIFVTGRLVILFTIGAILVISYSQKIFKNIPKNMTIIFMILLFVVSGESLFNATTGFLHSSSTSRSAYIQYLEPVDDVLKFIDDYDNDDNKFFRQEFNRFTAINESTMYHYNGFSIFSSMAYGNTSKLMEHLGIASTGNSYRYYDPTPLIDSMFNIKYVMTKSKILDNYHYNFLGNFDEVGLYENIFPLSLGFMVDEEVKEWDTSNKTPFEVQNDFIQKAVQTNSEILTSEVVENFKAVNVDITEKENKTDEFTYTLHNEQDLFSIPTVTANLVSSKTQRLYIYVNAGNAKRFKYEINGHTHDRELSTGRSLIDLGIVQKGQVINIEFSLDRKGTYDKTYHKTGSFEVYAAGFEDNLYASLYQGLQDEVLIVDEYDSTYLKGEITAKEDGLLFTSIPYDKYFKAYVDGEEVETLAIANEGLIGLDLKAGTHTIEFKYKSDAFIIGLILTILSIIGIKLYPKYHEKYKVQALKSEDGTEENIDISDNSLFINNLGSWVDKSRDSLKELESLENIEAIKNMDEDIDIDKNIDETKKDDLNNI